MATTKVKSLDKIGEALHKQYLSVREELIKARNSSSFYKGFRKLKSTYFKMAALAKSFGYTIEALPRQEQVYNKQLFVPTKPNPKKAKANTSVNDKVFNPNVKEVVKKTKAVKNKRANNQLFVPPKPKVVKAAPPPAPPKENLILADNVTTDPSEEIKEHIQQEQAKGDEIPLPELPIEKEVSADNATINSEPEIQEDIQQQTKAEAPPPKPPKVNLSPIIKYSDANGSAYF